MLSFPNAKINLGLRVTAKRSDGYHDIETIFLPLPLRDVVEVIKRSPASTHPDDVEWVTTGLPVPGDANDNLCRKAYRLLRRDFPHLAPVTMYLHKAIPIGAGLGGGSSDGATTLRLLADLFQLPLAPQQLENYARQLGSDCPFFLRNRPCYATGRGEVMTAIDVPLDDHFIVLVDAGIHVSTRWAFEQVTPLLPEMHIDKLITTPITTWRPTLINDFEVPVFAEHPELAAIKETLYEAGAAYASMTGTGSAIFGIFRRTAQPDLTALDRRYKVFQLR